MPDGWLILDKPLGLGSTQAVGAVKRNLREAGYGKVKTGHGGTLDPLASGVLPIALGEATKLAGRMLDSDKEYEFTVRFGAETDTLDLEGKVVAQSDVRPTLAEVEAVLPQFTGEIEQVPPAYSALMVDGQRAYDRARAGEDVVLAAIGAVLLGLLVRSVGDAQPAEPLRFIALNLSNFLTINIFLALFNLLPIPPFDGSHIVEGLLPPRAAASYERLRPLGFPLVLVLLVVLPGLIPGFDPIGRLVLPPVQWAIGHYLALAQAVAGA